MENIAVKRQKILSLLRAQLDIFPFVNIKQQDKSIGHVELTDGQYIFISFDKSYSDIFDTQEVLDFLSENNFNVDVYDEFK